jgi:hypothetical protein
MDEVDVRADAQLDDDNVMVTLTAPSWMLNINASPSEWARLSEVPGADWTQRQSVRLGTSNRTPVWWSATADQVTLCIGSDDESSDAVFLLPLQMLTAVEEALAHLDTGNWREV